MIKIGRNIGNGKEILPTNEDSINIIEEYCAVCHAPAVSKFDHIPDGWGMVLVSATGYNLICSKDCHEILKDRYKSGDGFEITAAKIPKVNYPYGNS